MNGIDLLDSPVNLGLKLNRRLRRMPLRHYLSQPVWIDIRVNIDDDCEHAKALLKNTKRADIIDNNPSTFAIFKRLPNVGCAEPILMPIAVVPNVALR